MSNSDSDSGEEIIIKPNERLDYIFSCIKKIENVNDNLREEINTIIKDSKDKKHEYHDLYSYFGECRKILEMLKNDLTHDGSKIIISKLIDSMIFLSYKADILYTKPCIGPYNA
ncbi:hypothetical protein CHBEV_334 [Choristoneura biennis entomopoxvirus]|uniref:Uncharacterized protein n=1 Tax=Choristoneura biennis entomopoxvirus TaxID=10288 RepID=A0A916NY62_CBEPV|nr:hypothetical protein CHBEV_001 [Choristoneura biennis entomopoxvirus]YP_008004404.1 hypothetical protein CHBEV_334 [Choristoneura biennis entomopoxvirus]CCU55569.1 hypothetical protein CHBEV_001 [Choristoneura biennis entomopoxvirus]CCU55902.1 hypothetical protein CHBEV_334 [Choristoneura biennis entomopoxvirus]